MNFKEKLLMAIEKLKLARQVSVKVTARLHMGFFDLNGSIGRRFGSIGLSLDAPVTEIKMQVIESAQIKLQNDERVAKIVQNFITSFNLQKNFNVDCIQEIPKHAGLGSGTQMTLAIGNAINLLCGLDLSLQQIAVVAQRGARSGIGVGTFEYGGMVVDAGRGATTHVPPVIARAAFPKNWRILLIFDSSNVGTHGEQELHAFRTLPNSTLISAEKLSHRILMQALPALAEQDLVNFGTAIRQLQHYTGEYFAPIQGGIYASQSVGQALNYLESQGVTCFGQSSWGPTGFAIFANQTDAEMHLRQLEIQFKNNSSLTFQICCGLNRGAQITVDNDINIK